jgi:hypothetical protein
VRARITPTEKEMTMMYSRGFENGAHDMDRIGVEGNAPLQHERNVTRNRMVIALAVLTAGALILSNHQALARGEGGHGGDTAGTLAEVSSRVMLWEAVPTGVVSAAEVSVTL